MTHIHKYRLPIRHRHPNALRHITWAIVILLAVYGLWYSITSARAGYQIYAQHEAIVMAANEQRDRAMADVVLAMEMLGGEHHITTDDGLEVAQIEWQEILLVEGLR